MARLPRLFRSHPGGQQVPACPGGTRSSRPLLTVSRHPGQIPPTQGSRTYGCRGLITGPLLPRSPPPPELHRPKGPSVRNPGTSLALPEARAVHEFWWPRQGPSKSIKTWDQGVLVGETVRTYFPSTGSPYEMAGFQCEGWNTTEWCN